MLVQTPSGYSGFHGYGQGSKTAALVLHDERRYKVVAR